MKNFHKDRRLLAYAADIWRSRDLSVDTALERIFKVLDIISIVRAATDRSPVSRNQIRRITKLTSDELDELLEPLLPIEQQKQPGTRPTSYRVIRRVTRKPGSKGRPADCYEIIGQRRYAGGPRTTWDGNVLDAGYRESLQWDIAVEVWNTRWIKEADLTRLFRNYPTPDGEGTYGVEGVRAHIEEMVEWNRLRRASTEEARRLIGNLRATGAVPAVILKGDVPLNPKSRARAKRWDAAEFVRTLDIKRAVAEGRTLESAAVRNAPLHNDPSAWEESLTEGELLENAPAADEALPAEQLEQPVPEPEAEPEPVQEPAPTVGDIEEDEDGWPADEAVAEDVVAPDKSSLESARSRNRQMSKDEQP